MLIVVLLTSKMEIFKKGEAAAISGEISELDEPALG